MELKTKIGSLVIAFPLLMFGQQIFPYSGATRLPRAGQITLPPDEVSPASLDLLTTWSDSIVEGSVTKVFPSIVLDPNLPGQVFTPSLFAVTSVLKGTTQLDANILLLEQGGTQGEWNVVSRGNPLVQPGEHYVLFLSPFTENLKNSEGIIPDNASVHRYEIVASASGKARVSADGNVTFAPAANPFMLRYNDTPRAIFVKSVSGWVVFHTGKAVPYPVGITPAVMSPRTPIPAHPLPASALPPDPPASHNQ
jgi:hypothetical protein